MEITWSYACNYIDKTESGLGVCFKDGADRQGIAGGVEATKMCASRLDRR